MPRRKKGGSSAKNKKNNSSEIDLLRKTKLEEFDKKCEEMRKKLTDKYQASLEKIEQMHAEVQENFSPYLHLTVQEVKNCPYVDFSQIPQTYKELVELVEKEKEVVQAIQKVSGIPVDAFTLGDAARVATPTVVTAGNDNCSTTNDIIEDAKSPKDKRIDEYFVEHEVSMAQAKAAAKQLDPDSMDAAAGCQPCTRHEIHYCLGPALMNDHCCCDRRYKEVFPHVPHTCYLGERLCQPIARDCGEYIRLRACCCDKYVAYKWKAISSANRLSLSWLWFLLLIVLRIT